MVRSVGLVAVMVGLAWTGLAGAQSSSPLEKARFINVSEEGKPPQRCKLLKTWHEANGAAAFQVQAVDTGELMTIVGTSPSGEGGNTREMTTRIFHWGRDNKPPAGAPLPPSTTSVARTPSQPTGVQKTPTVAPQPFRPAPVAAAPRPAPVPQTVQRPNLTPAVTPTVQKPILTPVAAPTQQTITTSAVTTSTPESPTIVTKPAPVVSTKPLAQTPTTTQVVQYAPASPTPNRLPEMPKAADTQPRLAPLAAGNVGNQNPCNGSCSQPCDPCAKPCNPCCQSPFVCTTPARQPLIGRLFNKSNASCPCTTMVCQPSQPAEKPTIVTTPAAAVVQTTEPARPSDWRQSWGKVEPSKGSAQTTTVRPIDVSKRVDPKPVTMETSTQPDPLKAPDQYRDIVMSSRLANSKIPHESQSPTVQGHTALHTTVTNGTPGVQSGELAPSHPGEPMVSNEGMPRGRVIEVSADEPNAFWTPKSAKEQEKVKLNPFGRPPQTSPQPSVPPSIAGVPPRIPRVPPDIPGVAINMLPPRPPVMNMPTPPLPRTAMQGGPVVTMPDTGVPAAMGNAFTLPATSRPIPADFGGTPQEPNGFDPMARAGQGAPPRGYGMAMPGGYRQPMSNMMAMGQQAAGVNPYMNVPTMPNGQAFASGSNSSGVPHLLATLKDSLRPSEREAAAEQLSELNWRIQPLVVESLMKSARDDPAATVRAACVHALAHMKVDSPAACALVRDLRSDRDPHVRQEAEEALNALGGSGIQQATHK